MTGTWRGEMLQWGRRLSPTDTCQAHPVLWRIPSFNGAVGFRLRIQLLTNSIYGSFARLQWGRRLSPTDTGIDLHKYVYCSTCWVVGGETVELTTLLKLRRAEYEVKVSMPTQANWTQRPGVWDSWQAEYRGWVLTVSRRPDGWYEGRAWRGGFLRLASAAPGSRELCCRVIEIAVEI